MLFQGFLEQINVLGVENESVSQAGLRGVKGIFKCPGFTPRESRERMNVLKKGLRTGYVEF